MILTTYRWIIMSTSVSIQKFTKNARKFKWFMECYWMLLRSNPSGASTYGVVRWSCASMRLWITWRIIESCGIPRCCGIETNGSIPLRCIQNWSPSDMDFRFRSNRSNRRWRHWPIRLSFIWRIFTEWWRSPCCPQRHGHKWQGCGCWRRVIRIQSLMFLTDGLLIYTAW